MRTFGSGMSERIFDSFFLGGFECSTHRLSSGKRLDEVAFTKHDVFSREDYLRCRRVGIRTVREGLRWHLIEESADRYDFSSALPLIRAAHELKVQVIWDLFHYGWPDWLDIFKPEFIDAFAGFARAFARVLAAETDHVNFVAPVNEISFFSWAGGQSGIFNPFVKRRGDELKAQLVRASIVATEALWDVDPRTRIAQIDPMINVLPADVLNKRQVQAAEGYRLSQYAAWDMLAGRLNPELGGAEKYLDIIGGNYYVHNQWIHKEGFISQHHPRYKPFREMIKELYERYRRPFFVAETGIEDEKRPEWFRYIAMETRAALKEGVQVEGICLYPIVNHPGWVDDRHCHNGLWDYPDEKGNREMYQPLADELQRQRKNFPRLLSNT